MNVHEISKSTQISGAWHISLHYLKWNYYFTKRGDLGHYLPFWYLQTLLGVVVVVIVK